MKNILFCLIIISLHATVLLGQDAKLTSQTTSSKMRKADKAYEKLGYKVAADLYKKMSGENEMDSGTMEKIANSYRLNNETTEAEYWYAKCVNEYSQPTTILNYAQTLLTNKNCKEAANWYAVFNDKVEASERVNLDFISNCAEVESFMETPAATIVNLVELNSENLDYSAMPFKNGIVFTSTRGISRMSKKTDNWTKGNFSDLFFAERQSAGEYATPRPLKGEINGQYHDGVATFNSNQDVMFFSRNNRKGKSKKGMIDLKVYQVEKAENGTWKNAKDLSFNSDEFASCHPALSADGTRLYFASDRPDGFGGMDLYVCKNVNGRWSAPENLGASVNTSGNELFPFMQSNDVLYFASNGHRGMGGLDIFVAQKTNETSWSKGQNIGTPFNTEKDDFGFVVSADKKYGYLTSNRVGGKGEDDLYEWVMDMPLDFFNADMPMSKNKVLTVIDGATQKPLKDAIITWNNPKDKKDVNFFATDEKGTISFVPTPGDAINFVVRKSGYENFTTKLEATELMNPTVTIPNFKMKKKMCTAVNGVVINKDCDKPMPGASVRIFNKCTGEKETIFADANGEFDYCLDCACDYEILGTKEDFTEDEVDLKTIKGNCNSAKPFDVKLKLSLDENPKTETRTNYKSSVKKSTPPPTKRNNPVVTTPNKSYTAPPRKSVITSSLGILEVGKTLELKNIFYDYNKASIRVDATIDLDNLAEIMKQYPAMEVELSSHTDARGSADYNQQLSANRAASAAAYLVKKGIARNRMTAKGYGESRLKNNCKDGVKCSNEEHQINRRTEVKITKM